jgi:hypothetical protein
MHLVSDAKPSRKRRGIVSIAASDGEQRNHSMLIDNLNSGDLLEINVR